MAKEFEKKWFILAIILLAAFFLFKLANQAQIMQQFPLDQNNDLNCYLGELHNLKQYGFHNIASSWYNGYSVLNHYPPGWFFFALPVYMLFGNIQLAAFISHILIYLLGLIFFIMLGKSQHFSFEKTLFFYLVLYVNPIAVGNFIKLGKLPELLALTLFIGSFAFMLNFKEKPIRLTSMLYFALLLSAILLAHPTWFIVSALFIPGIFMLKNRKEKTLIAFSVIFSVLLASFWLVPYLLSSYSSSSLTSYVGLFRLLDFKTYFFDNLFSYILPILLWFAAFFYFRNFKEDKKKLRQEIIFYSIPLLLSILYFTRLAAFIPIINRPFPDTYNLFFIFLAVFLFLKTPQENYGKILGRIIKLSLVLLPFIFILSSVIFVPNFRLHNETDKEVLSLLPHVEVNDKFLIEGMPYPTSALAFYSYAAIYHGLSTPAGAMSDEISPEMFELLSKAENNFLEKDCNVLIEGLARVNTTKVIGYAGYCDKLNECAMKLEAETANTCLYSLEPAEA